MKEAEAAENQQTFTTNQLKQNSYTVMWSLVRMVTERDRLFRELK
jgi:hypothetical protein